MSRGTDHVIDDIKSGFKGVRGVGDALRGTFNGSIDHAFNQTEGEAKNRAIAEKGEADMRKAEGVVGSHKHHESHPAATHTSHWGSDDPITTPTTTTGAHSTAPGNIGATQTATGARQSNVPQESTGTSTTY